MGRGGCGPGALRGPVPPSECRGRRMTCHGTPAHRRTLLLNHLTCKTQANAQLPLSRPRSLDGVSPEAEPAASLHVQGSTHPVANCPCPSTHRVHRPPQQAWVALGPIEVPHLSCSAQALWTLPKSDRHPLLCSHVAAAGTFLVQPQATRALPLSIPTQVGTESGLVLGGLRV